VTLSLLEGGFRRVVILGDADTLDDLQALARSIYRDNRTIVLPAAMPLWPKPESLPKELADPAVAGPLRVLAAMQILGHPGLEGEYRFAETEPWPLGGKAIEDMEKSGVSATRWLSSAATQPSATPRMFTDTDVVKVVDILRQEARRCDALPALFARYQMEVRGQDIAAPWSLENYAASVAAGHGDAVPPNAAPPVPPAKEPAANWVIIRLDLPEEAQPAAMRKHRVEFITAREMAERMKDDPVAVLPCGSFEMHGPHGMLGTDTIVAYSQALVVAKPWNAVVFPPIYYSFAGATERWPGTVSVSPEMISRHVKAVVCGLLDSGYKRVVILWAHAPGWLAEQAVIHEIQRERGHVVFSADLDMGWGPEFEKALGYPGGEDIASLAGVKLMGHPGVFAVDEPADVGMIRFPFHTIGELNALGAPQAWSMGLPTQHLAVRKCVRSGDDDRMIPVMRKVAAGAKGAPQAMSRYLDEIEKAQKTTLTPSK
jgi:hypothetical protein